MRIYFCQKFNLAVEMRAGGLLRAGKAKRACAYTAGVLQAPHGREGLEDVREVPVCAGIIGSGRYRWLRGGMGGVSKAIREVEWPNILE